MFAPDYQIKTQTTPFMIIKLKQALLFTGTILSTITFSQSYTIIPGEEKAYNKEEGVLFDNYMFLDNSYLYESRENEFQGEDNFIYKLALSNLSNQSGKVAAYKLNTTKRDLTSEIELNRAVYNDQLIVISFVNDLDQSKKNVYVRRLNFDGTEKEKDRVLLFSIDCNKKEDFPFCRLNAYFSPDQSKMMVIRRVKGETAAMIYDVKTLSKISESNLAYLRDGKETHFIDFLIQDNNDILCYSTMDNVNTDLNSASYMEKVSLKDSEKYPAIFKFKLNEKKPIVINLPESCSTDSRFQLKMVDGYSYAFGTCLNKSTKKVQIFYAKLDIQAEKFPEFNTISPTPDITNKLNETERSYLSADKIYVKDGDVFVFCLNAFHKEMADYNGRSFTARFTKELIVGSFNAGKDTKKISLVPKYTNMYLRNYHVYSKNNALYIIYAEHPKNLEDYTLEKYDAKKYRAIENYNGSVTVCTKISADGSMKREPLFENKGWCFKPENLDIVIEKENTLLLHMIKGKKERFDKLILQ